MLVHTLSHGGVSAAHSCKDGSINRGDCGTAMYVYVMQINLGISIRRTLAHSVPQLELLQLAPHRLHNLIPRRFATEILIVFAYTGP